MKFEDVWLMYEKLYHFRELIH